MKRYYGTASLLFIWIAIFLSFLCAASLFQETPFYNPNANDFTLIFATSVVLMIFMILCTYYKNRLSRDIMNIPIRLREQQLIITLEGIQSGGPVF